MITIAHVRRGLGEGAVSRATRARKLAAAASGAIKQALPIEHRCNTCGGVGWIRIVARTELTATSGATGGGAVACPHCNVRAT